MRQLWRRTELFEKVSGSRTVGQRWNDPLGGVVILWSIFTAGFFCCFYCISSFLCEQLCDFDDVIIWAGERMLGQKSKKNLDNHGPYEEIESIEIFWSRNKSTCSDPSSFIANLFHRSLIKRGRSSACFGIIALFAYVLSVFFWDEDFCSRNDLSQFTFSDRSLLFGTDFGGDE